MLDRFVERGHHGPGPSLLTQPSGTSQAWPVGVVPPQIMLAQRQGGQPQSGQGSRRHSSKQKYVGYVTSLMGE